MPDTLSNSEATFPVFPVLHLCIASTLITVSCSDRIDVKSTSPRRGEIREFFDEPARTRLQNTYLISMPVNGRINRIVLEPGDPVRKGMELVEVDRRPLELALSEARAAVEAAEAEMTVKADNKLEMTALLEAKAAVEAANEALNAVKGLKRSEALVRENVLSEEQLDDSRLDADTALIELRRQEFYRAAINAVVVAVKLGPQSIEKYLEHKLLQQDILVHRLEQAQAQLAGSEYELGLARVTAPVDGVVLERYERGRSYTAGRAAAAARR
jgi:HlyD family secretion protein